MVLCFREGEKQTSKRNARKKRGVDNCWSNDLKWEIGNGMPARCMENSFTEPGQEFDPRNTDTVGRWIKVKVTQLCLTLCDSMDYSPWNSPGQNTGRGSGTLLQGIFPIPGIEPRSPALQADSLPAEPQGRVDTVVKNYCLASLPRFSQ